MSLTSKSDIRISIITIVWNGAEFIAQTINSVSEQTYPNLEYIIIDGLSTDGTIDIIKSYESKVTSWISEKDEGIADAFNKGLALATGDYILYLNADDKLANTFVVADMVNKILEHKFPTLIYGDIEYIHRQTGRVLQRVSMPFSPQALLGGKMIPHPSLFTHRSYFTKYGKFDITFKTAMDYEWLLRGVFKEDIVYIPLLMTSFRDGGVSTINEYKVKDEMVTALKNNGFFSSNIAEIKMRIYFYLRITVKRLLSKLRLYNLFINIIKK